MNVNEWLNDVDITIKDILEGRAIKDKIIFLSALLNVRKNLKKQLEHMKETATTIINDYSIYLNDELEGAELYLTLYEHTLDVDFLKMAYDECTHAKKFIDLSNLQDTKEATDLAKIVSKINRIKTNIKMT